jgi:hypothetical protein
MKEFRTEINLQPSRSRLNLRSRLLTQGSCFSDAIGDRLNLYKFKTLVNPFGVMYNPESIHKVLTYALYNEPAPDHTYLHHQDVFLNYDFHSAFSALEKEELHARIIQTIGTTHFFLKDLEWLVLTYGTAWVYERTDTGEIVANCHKVPGSQFSKTLLTPGQIIDSFRTFYTNLKKFNPGVNVILTVSPVRHIKDTLELNSVSKATLRLSCQLILNEFPSVEYFPAYELMMDDLRDYRFYKADMLHPTKEAEDYIWEKFVGRYVDEQGRTFIKKWNGILSALHHRPFHSHTASHQQFLKDTLKKLEELNSLADVEEEARLIKDQILNRKT